MAAHNCKGLSSKYNEDANQTEVYTMARGKKHKGKGKGGKGKKGYIDLFMPIKWVTREYLEKQYPRK